MTALRGPLGVSFAAAILLLSASAHAQEAGAGGCVGKVRLRGPLWDSANMRIEAGLDVVLDDVARTIREQCHGKAIVIESHAYEMPTPELNQKLSELRVALVRYELEKRGVPTTELLPVPLGDTRPLVPKDKPGAVLENRRITFRVVD